MKARRFKDLLKVKKQALLDVERQIEDVRVRILRLRKESLDIDSKISSLQKPQEGDFGAFQLAQRGLLLLIGEKDTIHEQVIFREEQLEGLNRLYQEVNIEHEKILHLDKQEQEEIALEMAKEESKEMDEIANILFANRQKKRTQ